MNDQPLRADDAVIIFADLQEGIINVGLTADQSRLRVCVAALADIATICSIPVAISCVPTTSGTVAPPLAEIAQRFPAALAHVRTTPNPLDDGALRATLEKSGRKVLIIAGVVTEVAVALAAFAAHRLGYAVTIAVDACSGLDARSESAAFTRMSALGITLSSVPTIVAELAQDFSSERGRAAMRALQSMIAPHAHTHAEHDHDRAARDEPD